MAKPLRYLSLIAILLFAIFSTQSAYAQLTGTKNIPGDYATLELAVNDLNIQGVGAGGVVLNVVAANPQSAPAGGYSITATGTVANPITITGNSNTITASNALVVGNLNDGIFKLIGSDYVTIQGFTMLENAANLVTAAATNNMTEWGVALLYATATDGAQNCTIQNNTITLNRSYQNTFGIYSNSTHTALAVTVSASATGATGGNSGLRIYSNAIDNVNLGIVIVGPTAIADANTGIDVGGSLLSQGNVITNYGTTGTFSAYANVSTTVNGILIRNSNGFNCSYNTVTSSVGGVTAGTLNGIQVQASSSVPTATFTNNITFNSISLKSGLATGAMNGITYPGGSASTTSISNINNNDFNNFGHTVAASGAIIFITTASTNLTTSISNNTFTNMTVNTTGSVTFISMSFTVTLVGGSKTVNGNSIVTGFSKTGAGGTVLLVTDNGSSSTVVQSNCTNNNFSNITVTGATTFTGLNYTDGGTAPSRTVSGNTLNNWTGGTNAINCMNFTYWSGTTSTLNSNTISNITGQGIVTGITIGNTVATANPITVANNTVSNLSSTGTGNTVTGITCSNNSPAVNLYGNTVNTLSSTGASLVSGITFSNGTATNIFNNKVYDLSGTNASSTVSGITISGGTINVFNNLVGDLRAINANAANPVNGINITGGTTISLYNNSVNIAASSGGALFGSSAVSASTSATVVLRNNIFYNTSTPSGAGIVAAYRRTTTTLTSYGASSNNNEFYAGTPSASNLLFYDGTNSDQTIAALKLRLSPRDANSVSEALTFRSTTGSNAHYLKLDSLVATQCESGGTTVASPLISDDYYNIARFPFTGYPNNLSFPATAPDIGANEFGGIPIDLSPPSITYTNLSNTPLTTNRTLTATITDASGVAGGTNKPRLYYRKTTDITYVFDNNPSQAGNDYTWTIDYAAVGGGSVTSGDIIQYYVAAQDNNGVAGTNPSGGSGSNPPGTVDPGVPNTYNIVNSLTGTFTVGTTTGTYTTLQAAFDFVNANAVASDIILQIQPEGTVETGTAQLNAVSYTGAAHWNITIKPAAGSTPTIASSSATPVLLNGADYVIIDGSNNGSTTRDLTISTTSVSTASALVWMQTTAGNDASTNNTLKNCNLTGNTNLTTLFGAGSGGTAISNASLGTSNNSNTFQNNNIIKTQYGIYSSGASVGTKNTGTVISQNVINGTNPNNVTIGGIYARFEDGIVISGNNIGGIDKNLGALTGTAFGIALGLIPNNAIATFTGSDVINATVSSNIISGVTNTNATGYSSMGIVINTVTSGTTNVINNSVSGILSPATATDYSCGILLGAGAGSTTNCYYNSVYLSGNRGAGATYPSSCVALIADNTINLKNNIFYNSQTTASTGKSYCISTIAFTYANLNSDNNDFYVTGASGFLGITGGLFGGNDRPSLAVWQSTTSKDANSLSADPAFTSTTNLVIDATSPNAWYVSGMGQPIATVAVDILGAARTTTIAAGASDIGAYNVTPASTPPDAVESPVAPVAGGTSTYTFGGKLIATITWGAGGTPPTSMSVKMFGGTNGPGTGAYTVGNAYWLCVPTGGAGYSYDITLNYDDSQLGPISPEADARIGKSDDGGTTWVPSIVAGTGAGQYALNTTLNTLTLYGQTSFSYFVMSDLDNLVPVELSSFSASVNRRVVNLNWSTVTEVNNSGFEIERKEASSQSYSKIGFVQGNGTTSSAKNYTYEDRNLSTGKYNYRLKQMDYNGNYKYYELSSLVDVGIPTKFDISQNYPNPFNPSTKINFDLPFDSKVQIKVFDMTGREMAQILNESKSAGYYTAQFNASSLSSGIYFYQINATGGNQSFVRTMKMVLVK